MSFEPWICVTFHLYNDVLFLVLFWMVRVLFGPHAARVKSNKIFLTELFLVCPTKLVCYCSHASWITVHKNIVRKLLPVRSYLLYRKRKSRNQELQRKLQKSLMFKVFIDLKITSCWCWCENVKFQRARFVMVVIEKLYILLSLTYKRVCNEIQKKAKIQKKFCQVFYSSLRYSIQIKIKFLLRDRTYENFILLFVILRADLNQSFSQDNLIKVVWKLAKNTG